MKVFYCSTCFECYYIHPQELAIVCGCTACSVMIDVYVLASCLLVSVYLWVYWCVVCYYYVPWICSIVICKSYHVPVLVCIGAVRLE